MLSSRRFHAVAGGMRAPQTSDPFFLVRFGKAVYSTAKVGAIHTRQQNSDDTPGSNKMPWRNPVMKVSFTCSYSYYRPFQRQIRNQNKNRMKNGTVTWMGFSALSNRRFELPC